MKTIYLDRSRIQDELECKRYRYLRYHVYNGVDSTGIETAKKALPLVNGSFIHETVEAIRKGASVEDTLAKQIEIYKEAIDEEDSFFLAEQLALLKGLVLAWVEVRLPQIESEFEVVLVEKDIQWQLYKDAEYELVVLLRCDVIEKSRLDGENYIREYKTCGEFDKQEWGRRFERSSQLICNILGVSESLGMPINGGIIEGFDKGIRMTDRTKTGPFSGKKVQNSPLCYAYKYDGNYSINYLKGAKKVASWEEMPIEQWLLEALNEDARKNLFNVLPPITFNDRLLQSWKTQTIAKELRYARMLEELADLDVHLPQNLNHCRRFKNSPCIMEATCFNGVAPTDVQIYQPRTLHHVIPLSEEE